MIISQREHHQQSGSPKRVLARVLVASLFCGVVATVMPLGINAVFAANTYYLNNGKLKFSANATGSIDTTGMVLQPFYYSSSAATWYKLTYGSYPLDMAIGSGTGGANWTGSTVSMVGALTGLTVTASTWTETTNSGGISTGYGTVVASGSTTIAWSYSDP